MRVMITGGTGFIGYHSTRALLDAGHEVRLLVRSEEKLRRLFGDDIGDFVCGDVTDAGNGQAERVDPWNRSDLDEGSNRARRGVPQGRGLRAFAEGARRGEALCPERTGKNQEEGEPVGERAHDHDL